MTRSGHASEALLCACGLVGPAAWFVLLCVAWAIAPAAHEPGWTGPLLGLHALALAAAAAPGLLAYRVLRQLRREPGGGGLDPAGERTRFLAGMALALSALAILLVLASAVPLAILAPGAEP
jgi:hypothetical protein